MVSARLISYLKYLERPARVAARIFTVAGSVAGRIAETLGLLGLGIGIVLQLWQLLFRNIGLLRDLPLWVNDASTLALVCGALIYAAASESHLGFEGIAVAFQRRQLQKRINLVTRPIVAACLIILVYAGFQFAQQSRQVGGVYSTTFWSPLWVFYLVFPIALVLAAVRWLGRRADEAEQTIAEARAEDISLAHTALAEGETQPGGAGEDGAASR